MPQAVLRAATTEMDELVEKIGQHVNVPVSNVLHHCHNGCNRKSSKQNNTVACLTLCSKQDVSISQSNAVLPK